MSEDKKDKNEHESHDELHDAFEEEFVFESEVPLEDALASDELELSHDEPKEEKAPPSPHPVQQNKSVMLPALIVLGVVGFIGWKLYHMFTPKPASIETAQLEPVPQEPAIKNTESAPQTFTMPNPSAINEASKDKAALPQQATSSAQHTSPSMPGSEAAGNQQPTAAELPPGQPNKPTGSKILPPPATATPQSQPKAAITGIPTTAPHTEPATATTTQQPVNVQQPMAHANQVANEAEKNPGLQDNAIKSQKTLDEQQRAHTQQMQVLEKEITNVIQSTNNNAKSINAMQNDLATLAQAVKELTQEVKATREEQQKRTPVIKSPGPKAAASRPSSPSTSEKADANPSYSVYAIIPGRAWLRGANGKTLTVSEGDAVGEYGKVLKIDAGNGVVITSSGVTLR